MDVAREYRSERRWDVGVPYHVIGRREAVVRRAHRRAFDAVVQAEQAMRCRCCLPPTRFQQLREPTPHLVLRSLAGFALGRLGWLKRPGVDVEPSRCALFHIPFDGVSL